MTAHLKEARESCEDITGDDKYKRTFRHVLDHLESLTPAAVPALDPVGTARYQCTDCGRMSVLAEGGGCPGDCEFIALNCAGKPEVHIDAEFDGVLTVRGTRYVPEARAKAAEEQLRKLTVAASADINQLRSRAEKAETERDRFESQRDVLLQEQIDLRKELADEIGSVARVVRMLGKWIPSAREQLRHEMMERWPEERPVIQELRSQFAAAVRERDEAMAGECARTEEEAKRWQDRIVATIGSHGLIPTDCSGNESGDPLDWTDGQVSAALFDARTKGVLEFARAILHGSEAHRAWLLRASEEFANDGCVTAPSVDALTAQPEGEAITDTSTHHYRGFPLRDPGPPRERPHLVNGEFQSDKYHGVGSSATQSTPRSARGREVTPRAAVLWFAERMERKLRANDHKHHWRTSEDGYLSTRLHQEAKELSRALQRFHTEREGPTRASPETIQAVIDEAADVANFAMMIADNARRMLPTDTASEGEKHAYPVDTQDARGYGSGVPTKWAPRCATSRGPWSERMSFQHGDK